VSKAEVFFSFLLLLLTLFLRFFSSTFQSSLVFDCVLKTFQTIDRQTGNPQGYALAIDEKKRTDEIRHDFYPVVSALPPNDNSNIYINTSFGFPFLKLYTLTINIVIQDCYFLTLFLVNKKLHCMLMILTTYIVT
jgi:hypothetical protein